MLFNGYFVFQAYGEVGNVGLALEDVYKCLAVQPQSADALQVKKELLQKAKAQRAPDVLREEPVPAPSSARPDASSSQDQADSGQLTQAIHPGFSDVWRSPNLWERLKQDEGCRTHTSDPEFVRKIEEIRADPDKLRSHLADPRVVMAMTFLTGDGVQMSVTADDLKKAEQKGDIKKVEPVTTVHVEAARSCSC
eukprot:SAG31_NODE_64_length_28590_cov_17.914464_13_plen_194_part_00